MQIVFKNGNPLDCSLKNLIPLYTKADMKKYWLLRLAIDGVDVKQVDPEYDVKNKDLENHILTEHGRVFSLNSHTWLKWCSVHRLVCFTFNEPAKDPRQLFADHIDREHLNNHYTLLRWATPSENSKNRTCTTHQEKHYANV
jgi:hypothetical protein